MQKVGKKQQQSKKINKTKHKASTNIYIEAFYSSVSGYKGICCVAPKRWTISEKDTFIWNPCLNNDKNREKNMQYRL